MKNSPFILRKTKQEIKLNKHKQVFFKKKNKNEAFEYIHVCAMGIFHFMTTLFLHIAEIIGSNKQQNVDDFMEMEKRAENFSRIK